MNNSKEFKDYIKNKNEGNSLILKIENQFTELFEVNEELLKIKNELEFIMKERFKKIGIQKENDSFDIIIYNELFSNNEETSNKEPLNTFREDQPEFINNKNNKNKEESHETWEDQHKRETVELKKIKSEFKDIYNEFFKKASLLSHPDKLIDKSSDKVKEMTLLFQEMKRSMEADDICTFLLCCSNIGIPNKFIERKINSSIKNKIQDKLKSNNESIIQMKNNIYWKWSIGTEEHKKVIEDLLFEEIKNKIAK